MATALLWECDTRDLVSFAESLRAMGWNLLASTRTAKYLNEQGVPTRDIAELVEPPILDHDALAICNILAALSANNSPEDQAKLAKIGMPKISLVYVSIDPLLLVEEVGNPNCTLKSVIKKTDVGGPTLLRAAANGRRFVLCDRAQISEILDYLMEQLQSPKPPDEHERFISSLVWRAEVKVARYCRISADWHYSYAEAPR
ncbi:MAG: hypothetical protein Q7S49_02425 [bacterium]|nr:hypothetical protein [bacterium]